MWGALFQATCGLKFTHPAFFLHERGIPTSAEVGKAARLDYQNFLELVCANNTYKPKFEDISSGEDKRFIGGA